MGTFLGPSDLTPFAEIDPAKAEVMIEDAEALAILAAPCLAPDFAPPLTAPKVAAVRAILRGSILRWNEAGTGALSAQSAGPFGQTLDTRQVRKNMFWPSEISQLQDICKGDTDDDGAFSVDTVGFGSVHAEACSINFGALYCSCGADIAGFPLWEV